MRFIRKINRGVALMLVVVLGVVAYLSCMAVSDANVVKQVEPLCKEFIEAYAKYTVLPKDKDLNGYTNEMGNVFDNLSSEEYGKSIKKSIEANLKEQMSGKFLINAQEVSEIKVKDYSVNGKNVSVTVTVYLTQSVSYNSLTPSVRSYETRVNISFARNSEGKMEITYSNLSFADINYTKEGLTYEYNFAG